MPARLFLWLTVAALVLVGVAAAAWRAAFVADAGARLEPLRPPIVAAFHVTDPLAAGREAEIVAFDERFARHPLVTLAHVVAGGVMLVLAPLQFVTPLRNRHPALHRWSGRVVVAAAVAAALSGLYFGLLMPFGGPAESAAIALFGGLLLNALARGVAAIRRGRPADHRAWMLRAFALAVAISVVRVVSAPVDLVLTPLGFGPRPALVVAIWTGWLLSIAAAEAWIHHSRPAPGLPPDSRRPLAALL